MDRNFWIRLRSGIIVLGSAILFFWFGGIPLFALLAVVSLIGMFELYQAVSVWKTPLAAAGMMAGALFLEAVYLQWDAWLLFVLFLGFMLIMGTFVFTFPRYQFGQAAVSVFGVMYVPVMLSYLYRIRCMPDGFTLIWLVFIASWGSDTLAYCAGRLFGRHKMTPELSPKKTWEGAAGGVLGGALLGFLYALAFRSHLQFLGDPLLATPLLCAAGSIVSQIGDLAASAVKRSVGVKDYGNLIPGHGGILDRFDSVIVTAPLVYYLLLLVQ
nr:phosphatidate cytidylyltransferase [Lachnospiraceae bacterium]